MAHAQSDESVAHTIHHHLPDHRDQIAFHCQQAVEKYAKAVLVYFKEWPPKTHDISYLLEQIEKYREVENGIYEVAERLRSFAVEIRYPSGRYRKEDVNSGELLEAVHVFKIWALNVISGK